MCTVGQSLTGDFAAKSITQDLERLVKRKSDVAVDALPEMEKKLAVECLAVLINYLDFMSDEANFNKFCLKTFDISRYVKLDTAVVKSLNLIPSTSDSKEMCLYKLLNNCKTVSGQRLLKQWILQPLVDVNKIEERLDLVEVFILDSLIRQTIHEQHLSSLPDFTKIAKKLSLGKATLQDCYRVYQGLSKLPDLDSTLDEYTGEHRVLMNSVLSSELKELITDLSKFSALIEEVLDMDSVKTMEFLVRADFEEALGEIGEQMKALEKGMDRELQKVASELGLEAGKALKLESSSHLGYFLRLTRKDEKLIRNNKNFQILDTKKDGVRFTNRKLSKLSPEHLELKRSYQKLQVDVVTEVIKVAGGYAESLYRIGDLVSQLDVVISLAIASTNATLPYVRPKMLPKGSGVAELKELRHPCLEAIDVDVIPNDCVFNAENSMFHIITGPNMGGKSTYIRSVALTFLMAQMGSFVPCESATVTVVDSIMCRVGAGDSQLKGISTFMAEMLESSAILKAASESSLIVIDELGRGTATYDGFGLAWGISHYIATELKCFTLFATHFHEMTALADEVPHVTNMHVSALAEMNQMTLLYKVLPGVCDQSFGLHVAKMVNFPERVLEYARHKSQQLEDVESHATLDSLSSQITEEVKCARRKERIESYDLLQGFSDRLKELSSSTPSDILTGVEAIKQEMLQHGNSFIRSLASC
ncbi:MSH2 [Bugula neritina]|uniref:MSH2 n=1 Tax=Bugula neritina TaxID=10212 RepID=A0A7J7IUY0_BUGNE|nr:MSH2 [Bugula neritina]